MKDSENTIRDVFQRFTDSQIKNSKQKRREETTRKSWRTRKRESDNEKSDGILTSNRTRDDIRTFREKQCIWWVSGQGTTEKREIWGEINFKQSKWDLHSKE